MVVQSTCNFTFHFTFKLIAVIWNLTCTAELSLRAPMFTTFQLLTWRKKVLAQMKISSM